MVVLEEDIDSMKKDDFVFVLKLMGISCAEEVQSSSGEHFLTNGYLLSSKKVSALIPFY